MTRAAAPKLGAYVLLSAAGLVSALVLGRPEPVVLAAPFALVAGLALVTTREPSMEASVRLSDERVLEGEDVEVEVRLRSPTGAESVEVEVDLPSSVRVVEGDRRAVLHLARGGERALRLRVRCGRWGAYELGGAVIRARDPLGAIVFRQEAEGRGLRVYPALETLRTLVPAAFTQPFAGDEVARAKGEGIEFADLRPYVAGDTPRHINWRASARRSALWVNESHPERNTDVVIFLDTFAETRAGGTGTLDLAVRATASLADRYIGRKDRVGLVGFGGVLRWLLPGGGPAHLLRIFDALLDTEVVLNYAWKNVDVIPRRTLPPHALVIALTPLLDERSVAALLDLRARGFDLAVVEVSPEPFVTPGDEGLDALAYRLWRMRREALRWRFARAGAPIVRWQAEEPLAGALEEVTRYKRHAQRLRR